jgi:HNH endonuclease
MVGMVNARRSTGKRLRFEVFKRDYFTCQYCGAQPPDVVLVVDHAVPVAAGGASTEDNLITACEPCNQGKSDRPLGDRVVRPDADLLYLQTQQEVSELRRYQDALKAREAAVASLVSSLQEAWVEATGEDWAPAERVLRGMLNRFSPEVVGEAVLNVATKIGGNYPATRGNKWLPYLYTVAKNAAAEREGEV